MYRKLTCQPVQSLRKSVMIVPTIRLDYSPRRTKLAISLSSATINSLGSKHELCEVSWWAHASGSADHTVVYTDNLNPDVVVAKPAENWA